MRHFRIFNGSPLPQSCAVPCGLPFGKEELQPGGSVVAQGARWPFKVLER